jgi:uncharacterized lipoprotein YddW (UPF0748 family)
MNYKNIIVILRLFLFLVIPFLLVSCETTGGTARNQDAGGGGYTRAPSGEFRGAWVYDPRQFEPDDVVRDLKESGFNNVFVRLSSAGAAYYHSKVLPRAPGTNRDYAQEYAEAGKKYGVRVHAWHVCFMMHNAPSSAINDAIKKGEVMRDSKNRALRPTYNAPVRTPALAKNRLLEKQAMLELVTNYDLDGVQFDYIRYFSPNVDYSSAARVGFEKAIGVKMKKWPADVITGRYRSQYQEWKAELVTSLVEDVSQAVRSAKPSAKISAAVWHDPEVGLKDYCQDWPRWVRKGYLDFVVPMNYTTSDDNLYEWIAHQQGLIGNKVPLYAGLGSYMLRNADQFNRQIDVCRRSGLQGYVMYSYDEQVRRNLLRYVSN